jgi:thiol-disulfide isomerase/thioredoxin
MSLKKFDWKRWLDRALSVAAVVMIAWVLGKYFLPRDGEAVSGEAIAFLTSGQPTLIEFSQTHCPACVVSRPMVAGIRKDYEGRAAVKVYELDRLGDYPEGEAIRQLAPRLGVRATPTFVVLDGAGKPVKRFVGPTSGASLRQALDEALATRHSRAGGNPVGFRLRGSDATR